MHGSQNPCIYSGTTNLELEMHNGNPFLFLNFKSSFNHILIFLLPKTACSAWTTQFSVPTDNVILPNDMYNSSLLIRTSEYYQVYNINIKYVNVNVRV